MANDEKPARTGKTNPRCSTCGNELPPGFPPSLCPRCALGGVLDAPIPEAEKEGDRIDRYRLLEKIGEGGCGIVYMAEQEMPVRRLVALKVIKLGMDTREFIARFEAERQALALMDHPNIARVIDAGATETGRPFFVMELVRGIRITDYCNAQKLSTAERLRLFALVCHAVQHAHQKGIIHRDLKPSNILVTMHDGVPVPKVIDFGVAKATSGQRLTDRTLFTAFQQFIGTPAYMSPEQAEMSGLDIDTRTDIYSLGVLLYELLTGRTPFDAKQLLEAGLDEIRRRIREEEPPKPSTRLSTLVGDDLTLVARQHGVEASRLLTLVRGDLDWMVMKALEKDRTRRYATANNFAADIERHLANEPVTARPPTTTYKLQKFVRRNKQLAGFTVMVAATLVLGILASAWQAGRAMKAERKEARALQGEKAQRERAEQKAAESLERLVQSDVGNGVRAMENGDSFGALLWFGEALRQDTRGAAAEEMHRLRIGSLLHYSPRLIHAWFHDGAINTSTISPDGQWALTASRDGTARLWNIQTGQPGHVLRHPTNVHSASFSGNGQRVLARTSDGVVSLWNAASGQLACPPLVHGYRVTRAVASPDGRRVFSCGNPAETNFSETFIRQRDDGELRIWDGETGRQVRPPIRQKRLIRDIALSPTAQWLAANLGQSVCVWNLRDSEGIELVSGSEDKATIFGGRRDGKSEAAPEELLPNPPTATRTATGERLHASCFNFSPDGGRLLIGYADGTARIWPLRGGDPLVLRQPKSRGSSSRNSQINTASFSPDGNRILLLNDEGALRLWDSNTGEFEGQLKARASAYAKISPDGRFVFVDQPPQVWDMATDKAVTPRLSFTAPSSDASPAFTPDGGGLLTSGSDSVARLWSLSAGIHSQPRMAHDRKAPSAGTEGHMPPSLREQMKAQTKEWLLTIMGDNSRNSFSSDGKKVVTVGQNSARVWNAHTGEPITPYVFMDVPLRFVAFSPDDTCFVTAGGFPPDTSRGLARIWDATSGEPRAPEMEGAEEFISAAFDPCGQWLITQGYNEAQFWEVRTGGPARLALPGVGRIRSAAFGGHGKAAICRQNPSAPGDWKTQVWQLQGDGAERGLDLTNEISQLVFSPDGQWLVTFTQPREGLFLTLRVWNAGTGQPITPGVPITGVPQVTFTRDGRRLFLTDLFFDAIAIELPGGRTIRSEEWKGARVRPDAITAEGNRIAARATDGWQVFDAQTAEPVTPPLGELTRQSHGQTIFSPDGSRLLVPENREASLWPLPVDLRPNDDLIALAQLLSGRRLDAAGYLVPLRAGEAAQSWATLRAKYPDAFGIDRQQQRRWREWIAGQSEKEGHWFSAVFHLRLLSDTYPAEESFRKRRAQALNHLAMEQLK